METEDLIIGRGEQWNELWMILLLLLWRPDVGDRRARSTHQSERRAHTDTD
jgi:hypothetical protein